MNTGHSQEDDPMTTLHLKPVASARFQRSDQYDMFSDEQTVATYLKTIGSYDKVIHQLLIL